MPSESIVTKDQNSNKRVSITAQLMADKNLSSTAKLVMAVLLDHRNKKTGQCNPRESTLAEELGVSRFTIIRHLAELKTAGLIATKRTQRGMNYEFPMLQNCTSPSCNLALPMLQNRTSLPFTEPNKEPVEAAASSEVETAPAAAAAPKATPKPTQKPPARETDDSGFRLVRETLNEMAPLAGLPLPDDDLVRRVIEAANGASGQEIQDALVLMWKRGALRNMRSWGFIPIKIQDLARKAATA